MTNNVCEYLQQSVEKYPLKKAVSYKDHYYTFQQLALKVKKYSQAICHVSTDTTNPIGVISYRDIEPIAVFLGVAFSDNFYVPLDPDAPVEKLRSIIEDANMQIIIGTENYQSLIEEIGFKGTFIKEEDVILYDGNVSYKKDVIDDQPLYMVYTSGSTGKPKGVLKSHKAEISYIEAFCDTFDFYENDIIGNQTPFFFDAAAKDIYLMLKMGITMEIIPSEYFPLPLELVQYLNKKKITVASWVPTVLSIVAQLNPFSVCLPETLRRVFFVGEVMPMKHLNTWRSALPNIEYINLYGQSELCGICCYYIVNKDFSNDETLPMGKPLKNCQIYLVDNDKVVNQPQMIGELYIVSDALALQYYNDPEKSKNSFIMKDFGNGPVRCFKTGDLAQYDNTGNLVFASRSDSQIKHMGHRIELGEIEAVTGAIKEVNRCCCLYNNEKKRIVLFCELATGQQITPIELKSILKTKLSSYMVPWKINIMDKLPLNANGKIDRQKLKTLL